MIGAVNKVVVFSFMSAQPIKPKTVNIGKAFGIIAINPIFVDPKIMISINEIIINANPKLRI